MSLVISTLNSAIEDQIGFLRKRGINSERLSGNITADKLKGINVNYCFYIDKHARSFK